MGNREEIKNTDTYKQQYHWVFWLALLISREGSGSSVGGLAIFGAMTTSGCWPPE
jgi:hypothetical protein